MSSAPQPQSSAAAKAATNDDDDDDEQLTTAQVCEQVRMAVHNMGTLLFV